MHRPTLLIPALLALSSCDSYISVAEHQARFEVAKYSGWLHAQADARDESANDIGIVQSGRLREGEEASIPLDITGAHRAMVLGACDKRCSDLDLRVVTEDGRLIGIDDDEDDSPRVYINEIKANRLLLKVRMPRCEASSCAYAFSQLQYEDFAGGFGTCFAVGPNGLLMTSLHVVDGASTINVLFPDGRKGEAKVIRESSDNDLALLRTSIATPHWLPLASATDIAIGTPAFTVGFPSPQVLGSELKLTEGSISSLSGPKEPTLLQMSIPIQGGNSGGPVVDHRGRVLGIVESMIDEDDDGTPMQLTNFARHAQVAALLLSPHEVRPRVSTIRNRQEAIMHASKAVCQIKTE